MLLLSCSDLQGLQFIQVYKNQTNILLFSILRNWFQHLNATIDSVFPGEFEVLTALPDLYLSIRVHCDGISSSFHTPESTFGVPMETWACLLLMELPSFTPRMHQCWTVWVKKVIKFRNLTCSMIFHRESLNSLFSWIHHLLGESRSGSNMNENITLQFECSSIPSFQNHWPCNRWMHCYVMS